MSDHVGIRFKDGDAFPPDNPLARWITICAMALNDLLYVNRQLFPRLKGEIESADYENVYLARLAGAHLFEVAKFLEQSDRRVPAVQQFVKGLENDSRAAYEKVKSVGPRGNGDFAQRLNRARDQFFHYSALLPDAEDHEALKRAMSEHADSIGEIHDDGPPIERFRARFADDIAVELSFGGGDLEAFVTDMSEHIAAFLKFAFAAIPEYIGTMPREVWTYITPDDSA